MKNNNSFLTIVIIIFFQVVFRTYSFSQYSTKLDSTSIISYADKLIVKLNIDTQTDTYFIQDKLTNSSLTLSPNTNLKLSLSLDYEFIGVSIGFTPKFLPGNNDDDLKGKSSFTDYRFRFFLGDWTQGLTYSNIQGYYIENTHDFIPNWIKNEDPFLQFPNLKVITWGGSTSYVLNKRFSLRNMVYQTEWQRKSAGSFIPKLAYSFNKFSNNINGIKSTEKAYDLKLAPSYYYTWVIHRNWFVSTFLSPSLGIRFSNYEEEENDTSFKEKNQHLINALEGGLQLGYSSRKIIFGVNINFDASWYNEDKTTNVIDDKVYAKLYLGYKFNPPKIIQKLFKKTNKKLGYE